MAPMYRNPSSPHVSSTRHVVEPCGDRRGSARIALVTAALVSLVIASILASCASGDKSPLAADPSNTGGSNGAAGSGGSAGAGGAGAAGIAGAGGQSASGGTSGSSGQDASTDVAPDVFIEPDGDPRLTFVHGLIDVAGVKLCLVPWVDGAPADSSIAPLPSSGSIAYASSLVVPAPSGLSLASTALRPIVLSGDLSSVGVSCSALAKADPSSLGGLVLTPLPVLPAGTFTAERSLALIGVGCVSPDVTPSSACAKDSSLTAASAVLIEMSRVASTNDVGFQVAHGSLAMGTLFGSVLAAQTGSSISISSVGFSSIAPKPPSFVPPATAFGSPATDATFQIKDSASSSVIASIKIGDALIASGLTSDALSAGKNLVAIAIGPTSVPLDAGLVNPPSIALIAP